MNERPGGIGVLSLLHIVGGLAAGAILWPAFSSLDTLRDPLRTIGLPPILIVLGMAIVIVLAIVSGIGMWLGRKWGWWLGAFYYVYGIARNASALVTLTGLENELAASARGPAYYHAKHATRIVVHLLILLYFFRRNVLEYFELQGISKRNAIVKLVAACGAITGFATVLSLLLP